MFKTVLSSHCTVPENIHTPPQKGLEFPGGWGFYRAQKILKNERSLIGISRGVSGS